MSVINLAAILQLLSARHWLFVITNRANWIKKIWMHSAKVQCMPHDDATGQKWQIDIFTDVHWWGSSLWAFSHYSTLPQVAIKFCLCPCPSHSKRRINAKCRYTFGQWEHSFHCLVSSLRLTCRIRFACLIFGKSCRSLARASFLVIWAALADWHRFMVYFINLHCCHSLPLF